MATAEAIKGMAEKIKKMSKKPKGTKKTENGVTYWQDDDWHWEQGNLNKTEKIMKHNIKVTENGARDGGKNSSTGEKIPASHFKKNLPYEKMALSRVQQEIKNRKLIKNLKDREKKIANDVKFKRRDKVDEYLEY